MNARAWARRIGLGLVAGGSVAALLALTGAPQAAPQLEWTHSGANVTHFECFVDSAYAGNLGLPTPSGTTYSADLSLCGQITAGQHTLTVKACNYTNCTDTGTSLALVALGTIGTGTETCVGPDQAAVQNAVSAATYGDTVEVCAGTATWTVQAQGCSYNTAICIKKGMTLRGGIGGTTTITLAGTPPSQGAIVYTADSTSRTNDTPFSFTGFTINGGGIYWNNGMLDIRNSAAPAINKVTIHHNTFRNGYPGSKAIYINGAVYGVAYDNSFVDITGHIRVMGLDELGWALGHREYGTANNFYFEDNTASFSVGTSITGTGQSTGQGGSLASRYNTTDLSNLVTGGTGMLDLHGLQSLSTSNVACGGDCTGYPLGSCFSTTLSGTPCCRQWSQVKSEIYGNAITNLGVGGWGSGWVIHRGSWMLMFNNTATGSYSSSSYPVPKYRQYACDECQSPASPFYSQHIQNTYVFNNQWKGTDKPMVGAGTRGAPYGPDYCADSVGTYTITENVDYWNLDSTFDGTTGVGCGPLASRPATCTTGVGYWATNQSCTDMTGMTGANPSTPISGTLYKCTATNTWESYYTPYTYPHPKAATPAAASGLRVK